MTIDSTTSAISTASTASTVNTSGIDSQRDSLGKDAFMQLLITKMQNQDPTQPQDDSEMIAQLAQFSTLEQMQQMNTTLTQIAGFFSDAKSAVSGAAASPSTSTSPSTSDPTATAPAPVTTGSDATSSTPQS